MARPALTDTKGRKALAQAMKLRGLSQAALGELLSVGQQAVSSWMSGKSRPEHHWREALRKVFGIDPYDWMTVEERRRATRHYTAA